MMRILNLSQVSELTRQLQNCLVCIKETVLKEVNAFLGENFSHANEIGIRAPMLLDDFIQELGEVVFGATDNTKVWSGLLREADGNFHLNELFMV